MGLLEWLDDNIVQPFIQDRLAAWSTAGTAVAVLAYSYAAWSQAAKQNAFDRTQFEVPIFPPSAVAHLPKNWGRGTASARERTSLLSLYRGADVILLRRLVRAQLRSSGYLGLPSRIIFVVGPETGAAAASRFARHALGFPFGFGRTLSARLTRYWLEESAKREDGVAGGILVSRSPFGAYLTENPEMLGLEAMDPDADPLAFRSGKVDLGSWSSGDPRVWLATVSAINPSISIFTYLKFILHRIMSGLFSSSMASFSFFGSDSSESSVLSPLMNQACTAPYDMVRDHTLLLLALQAGLEDVTRRWLAPGSPGNGLIMFDNVDVGITGASSSGGGTMANRTFELFLNHLRGLTSAARGRGDGAESVVSCVLPVSGATAYKHLAPLVAKGEAVVMAFGDMSKNEARTVWESRVEALAGKAQQDYWKQGFEAIFEIFGGRLKDIVCFADHLFAVGRGFSEKVPAGNAVENAVLCFPDVALSRRFFETILDSSVAEPLEPAPVVPDYAMEPAKDPVGPLPMFKGPSGSVWNPGWTRAEAVTAISCVAETGCVEYRAVLDKIAETAGSNCRAKAAIASFIENGVLAYRPASPSYEDFAINRTEDCCTFGRPMLAWIARRMMEKGEIVV